jgi:hypothetical protein
MSTIEFTASDAEAAGWQIVHEADPSADTANAEIWRAEKYINAPGRAGAFVDVQATTEEKLYAAIKQREEQFSVSDEGDVILPAADAEEVDVSDESTIERVSTADIARRSQNDSLIVLSDPSDPESDPVSKFIVGGEEVSADEMNAAHEPNSQSEAETADANQAGIDEAIKQRDGADSAEKADNADAQAAVAAAAHESRVGDAGDSGNDPELVQPAAGEATNASDSEQQGQVPDAEAASSDAVSTNSTDEFPKDNVSQPEVAGPDSDAEAPEAAPNATPSAPAGAALSSPDEQPSTPTA